MIDRIKATSHYNFYGVRISATLIFAGALLIAWWTGRQSASPEKSDGLFQVAGDSMAPTVTGPFKTVFCASCDLSWKIGEVESSNLLCYHCGASVDYKSSANHVSLDDGDIVAVVPPDDYGVELGRGDLVSATWDGQRRIKRVAAISGDTVEVDVSGRLLVNRRRLEDLLFHNSLQTPLPRFLIDLDSRRRISRWSSESESWKRTADQNWAWTNESSPSWLTYGHRSIHDHNQPSPVWDDYPFNSGLSRRLNPVDRLFVSATSKAEADLPIRIEVAIWTSKSKQLVVVAPDNMPWSVNCFDGSEQNDLPVSQHHPVAIRIIGGPTAVSNLRIDRLIEYRVRSSDTTDAYPMKMGANDLFLVGDNVPVSEDSRAVGPIPIDNVNGIVTVNSTTDAAAAF